jgi:HSP20 family molecular chaperone IbpA
MTSLRDVGKSLSNTVLENVGRAMSRAQERTPLPVDLLESDEVYLAVFDAPGATSSDVQVRFTDRTIEVRIDRFRDFHEGFDMLVPGRGLSLDGSVTLPEGASVDSDAATATLHDNGSLHVEVPKADTSAAVADEVDVDDAVDEDEAAEDDVTDTDDDT